MTTDIIPSMSRKHLIRLFGLAMIWGFSFIFIRIAAPAVGAIITADMRALVAGLFLLGYLAFKSIPADWRLNMRHYLALGVLNAALPFLCFSYAGIHIPAGYSALLNATVPLFGVILSTIFLSEKMTLGKGIGIICGISGVALVARIGGMDLTAAAIMSIFACLLASACYAGAGVYIRKKAKGSNVIAITMGSQLLGGLMLTPLLPFTPAFDTPSMLVIISILALGIICTAAALVIYYQLIHDIGVTKASTVTFLVPMFGVLWAAVFLHEPVTFPMVAGMALILTGTRWVLKK